MYAANTPVDPLLAIAERDGSSQASRRCGPLAGVASRRGSIPDRIAQRLSDNHGYTEK